MDIDEALVERLAPLIHEQYVARAVQAGAVIGSAPGVRAWSDLEDGLRNANRDQARDVVVKLARIGCCVEAGADGTFVFAPGELETLAQDEHLRWARERRESGWVHGDPRDDAHKHHPSLVAWEALDEAERDKDREMVRAIPALLAAAGLHVARRPRP